MNSGIAVRHMRNQPNKGGFEDATHFGQTGVEGEGHWVKYWLRVEGGRIARVGWDAYGCPACIVTASLVAELATGRTLDQARALEPADLVAVLEGIPEGREDRPVWAVAAFREAMDSPVGAAA